MAVIRKKKKKAPHRISVASTVGPVPAALRPALEQVLHRLKVQRCQWHVEIVNDQQMAALHRRYLQDPTTTDVLTFDLRDETTAGGEGSAVMLDTVVCADEASRRAAELGHAVAHELLLYCIHSLLHVQGYDDRTKPGAARMHAREDELLDALGIGKIYSGRGRKRAVR